MADELWDIAATLPVPAPVPVVRGGARGRHTTAGRRGYDHQSDMADAPSTAHMNGAGPKRQPSGSWVPYAA